MTRKKKIVKLTLAAFIFALALAQIAYVQSTFLNQFFNLGTVSFIFFIAYIITFIVMNLYPNIIARFNNLNTAVTVFALEIFSLLIFILTSQPIAIFLAFILYVICINILFINFDVFLEAHTSNVKTGRIRGAYFTIYNIGWVISPFISGQILDKLGFNWIFSLVIILTLPIIFILITTFKDFKNSYDHQRFSVKKTLKELLGQPDLKKIFYLAFLLQVFYATMVIYTPIYLNQTIGLVWDQIGIIFSIMLLPFILIQYPAGYIADKYLGEKELLTTGLIITAIASILIFYTNTTNILIWALILFFSRIGASLIEIMRDSYFFKKVDVEDLSLINSFRSTMPLAYIFTPLIMGWVLHFWPIHYIFLILSLIMLTGLYSAITFKDTK
ncbi:MAG TPA: MFS transporter [Candidatus Uhrbacteria bacterium]|nr:MFS transporter [Candidatus Uhrbacteria bacterium]